MKSLHKQLSEMREMTSDELDLVGGGYFVAWEGYTLFGTGGPTFSYFTVYDGSGAHQVYNQDDGTSDAAQMD